MNEVESFYTLVKTEMSAILATSASDNVTMRVISPVFYDGKILFFTSPQSLKYKQLAQNPNCSIALGSFFAEATAEILGDTMLECNTKYREVYSQKFADAFVEGIEFGGMNNDFVLLTPKVLSGWRFENDTPTADGIPTIPFKVVL